MFDTEDWSAIQLINWLSTLGESFTNATLSHPNVQELLKRDIEFDAVVVEVFWAEALYGKIENINYRKTLESRKMFLKVSVHISIARLLHYRHSVRLSGQTI